MSEPERSVDGVKVEIQSENALGNIPGEIRIFQGSTLVQVISASVKDQPGADGKMYPAVSLEFKDLPAVVPEGPPPKAPPNLKVVPGSGHLWSSAD